MLKVQKVRKPVKGNAQYGGSKRMYDRVEIREWRRGRIRPSNRYKNRKDCVTDVQGQ